VKHGRLSPGAKARIIPALLAAVATLLAGCGQTRAGSPLKLEPVAALPVSRASHVVVIVMENKEASDVIGNTAAPYANKLAASYGLATQSYAISHPSLPNYLALTSGSTQGVTSDCTDCHVAARNIVDQLEAARTSWRAYLEDVPGRCFTGAGAGGYAKKHNPFIYFDDIANSPRRCHNLVGFAALAADLRAGRLPTYVWVSPNLCDDTHDCGVATGDRFLAHIVPAFLREIGPHGFVLITWDEGSSGAGCCGGAAAGGQVATIVAGPGVRRGARTAAPVDHYGVLGTIEGALGLAPLGGAADPRSGRLRSLFTRHAHRRVFVQR